MDRAGRVKVTERLTLPNQPNVFVIGDTASVSQDGKPLPGVAPVAMQQGRYVASVITQQVAGKGRAQPFRYRNRGNLHFDGPVATSIQFGKDVPAHEIDMGEGAFLLSAAYATQLLTPPKVEPEVTVAEDTQPGQQSPPAYYPPAEGGIKTIVNEPPTPEVSTMPPTRSVAPGRVLVIVTNNWQ